MPVVTERTVVSVRCPTNKPSHRGAANQRGAPTGHSHRRTGTRRDAGHPSPSSVGNAPASEGWPNAPGEPSRDRSTLAVEGAPRARIDPRRHPGPRCVRRRRPGRVDRRGHRWKLRALRPSRRARRRSRPIGHTARSRRRPPGSRTASADPLLRSPCNCATARTSRHPTCCWMHRPRSCSPPGPALPQPRRRRRRSAPPSGNGGAGHGLGRDRRPTRTSRCRVPRRRRVRTTSITTPVDSSAERGPTMPSPVDAPGRRADQVDGSAAAVRKPAELGPLTLRNQVVDQGGGRACGPTAVITNNLIEAHRRVRQRRENGVALPCRSHPRDAPTRAASSSSPRCRGAASAD